MATFSEDWSSFATGSVANNTAPSGGTNAWSWLWSTTGDWHVEIVEDGGAIGGKYLRLARTSTGSVNILLSPNSIGSLSANTDTEVLTKYRKASLDQVLTQKPIIMRAALSAGVHYGAYDVGAYDGGGTSGAFTWSRMTGSSENAEVLASVDVATTASDWWWMRVNVSTSSATWKWKNWKDGDAEPGSWSSSANDATQTTGYVGIGLSDYSSAPYEWDFFSVGTGGDAAPGPTSASIVPQVMAAYAQQ